MSDPTDWDDSLTTPLEGAAEASASEGATGPAVGRDEWVARHGERRARRGGVLGTLEDRLAVVPWWAWLTLFVAIVCLLPIGFESGYVRRVAFDTVVFMLLALGLNIVVGWGGLLDLGFVAFYGIGAYTYALLSSDQYDIHLPTLVVIPVVAIVGRARGVARRIALATPHGRLPRNRDAVLLPGVPHRDEQWRRRVRREHHERAERNPERRRVQHPRLGSPASHLGGALLRHLSLRRARVLRPRLCRAPSPERLAYRPRVAVAARGPAGRGSDGDAGEPPQADGVRVRRLRRRVDRDVHDGAQRQRLPPELRVSAVDHGLHDGHPRRGRQPGRGRRRGGDRQRPARGPARPGRRAGTLLRRDPARTRCRLPYLAQARRRARRHDRLRVRGATRRRGDRRRVDDRTGGGERPHCVLGVRVGDRARAARGVGPAGRVHRPRRAGTRADARPGLGQDCVDGADALPRRIRVGERHASPARVDALHRDRRAPRRDDDRAAAGPARREARGDL